MPRLSVDWCEKSPCVQDGTLERSRVVEFSWADLRQSPELVKKRLEDALAAFLRDATLALQQKREA